MNGFVIFLLILVGIAAAIGLFVLGVWMVVWNANDIAANGANFWNVAWLGVVALGLASLIAGSKR
jgi:hypothetical protein